MPTPTLIRAHHPVPDGALTRSRFTDPGSDFVGWADHVVNAAGDVSEWHQHPASETFVYVLRGTLTLKFGEAGSDEVTAVPGDLLRIPAGAVHQEVTGHDGPLEALVVRVGRMPETVIEARPVPLAPDQPAAHD